MTNKPKTAIWTNMENKSMEITLSSVTKTDEDVCPECDSCLQIVVGRDSVNKAWFRPECTICSWRGVALPDPQVKALPFDRELAAG